MPRTTIVSRGLVVRVSGLLELGAWEGTQPPTPRSPSVFQGNRASVFTQYIPTRVGSKVHPPPAASVSAPSAHV
jgi:hypothetical protein